MRILFLLLVISFSLLSSTTEPCRQIKVVPFISRSGVVDPFNLTEIVSKKFRGLGFEVSVVDDHLKSNCKKFSCVIWHSENYWQHKRDTVRLEIFDSDNELIAEYYGVTKAVELTFRSGYSKATRSALSKVTDADKW